MAKPSTRGLASLTEHDFVCWSKRIITSDEQAFNELFQVMSPVLLRYSWRFVGDTKMAEDIVQDVFEKLWRVRETIDPGRSLKAFLYTMVRNQALNNNRVSRRASGLPPGEDVTDSAASADQILHVDLLKSKLYGYIEEMPERRREAFTLSRYEGLSHSEIAEVMNLTPRTVNTHIVLALKGLRKYLEELQATPVS